MVKVDAYIVDYYVHDEWLWLPILYVYKTFARRSVEISKSWHSSLNQRASFNFQEIERDSNEPWVSYISTLRYLQASFDFQDELYF